MVNQIYPPELQLNKANTFDTEAPLLDLHLSTGISNGFVSCKIYDKRDDLNARNKCLTAEHLNQGCLERLCPSYIADTMNWF